MSLTSHSPCRPWPRPNFWTSRDFFFKNLKIEVTIGAPIGPTIFRIFQIDLAIGPRIGPTNLHLGLLVVNLGFAFGNFGQLSGTHLTPLLDLSLRLNFGLLVVTLKL